MQWAQTSLDCDLETRTRSFRIWWEAAVKVLPHLFILKSVFRLATSPKRLYSATGKTSPWSKILKISNLTEICTHRPWQQTCSPTGSKSICCSSSLFIMDSWNLTEFTYQPTRPNLRLITSCNLFETLHPNSPFYYFHPSLEWRIPSRVSMYTSGSAQQLACLSSIKSYTQQQECSTSDE